MRARRTGSPTGGSRRQIAAAGVIRIAALGTVAVPAAHRRPGIPRWWLRVEVLPAPARPRHWLGHAAAADDLQWRRPVGVRRQDPLDDLGRHGGDRLWAQPGLQAGRWLLRDPCQDRAEGTRYRSLLHGRSTGVHEARRARCIAARRPPWRVVPLGWSEDALQVAVEPGTGPPAAAPSARRWSDRRPPACVRSRPHGAWHAPFYRCPASARPGPLGQPGGWRGASARRSKAQIRISEQDLDARAGASDPVDRGGRPLLAAHPHRPSGSRSTTATPSAPSTRSGW